MLFVGRRSRAHFCLRRLGGYGCRRTREHSREVEDCLFGRIGIGFEVIVVAQSWTPYDVAGRIDRFVVN